MTLEQLITTAVEVLGALCGIAAAGVWVSTAFGIGPGLAAAAVACFVVSWVFQGAPRPHRKPKDRGEKR